MQEIKQYIFLCIIVIASMLSSCNDHVYIPKKKGYPKILLPAHDYRLYDSTLPFLFEYPSYGNISYENSKNLFSGTQWINIHFPDYAATLHISYMPISATASLQRLVNDAFELTYFHTKRADYIKDYEYENAVHRVYGVMYDVGGNSATAKQFYATDSHRHFIRAALYFDARPNADSLRPLNEFFGEDMRKMLESLQWK